MAIQATAVWRVRPGGNAANGAGYDAGISGAGTDYSQQDSPQLSVTDIACSASTTVTSATGGFTSAMIGNAIRITGGGSTSGYYFITARTDTNTITVDRSPGTVSGGTGKVGGAAASYKSVLDSSHAAGDKVVPGNVVYVRGAGTDTPASADYTESGFISVVAGDGADGRVQMVSENGRARIECDGLILHQCNYFVLRGFYLKVTGTANLSGNGMVTNTANMSVFENNVFDGGDQDWTFLKIAGGTHVLRNVFFSKASAPTANSNAHGILTQGFSSVIKYNRIHHTGAHGVFVSTMDQAGTQIIEDNLIYGCKGNGVHIDNSRADMGMSVSHNTIDGNEGHGINFTSATHLTQTAVFNNTVTNHVGSGKAGINAAGTLAVNDRLKPFLDYNNVWNNTSDYAGVSAGPNDLSVDPDYVDAATGDFTPQEATTEAAYPVTFP